VFFLLSGKIAAAYSSKPALRAVHGPVGLAVVGVCTAGILLAYSLSDLQGSSTGLAGFPAQTSLVVYHWLGYGYMAYVAACLIVPTGKAAISCRPFLGRAAALLLCLGFILVCATVPVQLSPWHVPGLLKIISFTSILCVAIGLALVWVSFLIHPAQAKIRK
jgi:hypothetical protein